MSIMKILPGNLGPASLVPLALGAQFNGRARAIIGAPGKEVLNPGRTRAVMAAELLLRGDNHPGEQKTIPS